MTEVFATWLGENRLSDYEAALADEGYEDIRALLLCKDDELEELASTAKMKPGHRKMLLNAVAEAKRRAKSERKRPDRGQRKQTKKISENKKISAMMDLPTGKRYAYFASHVRSHFSSPHFY